MRIRVNSLRLTPNKTFEHWCPFCDFSKAERWHSRFHHCTSDAEDPPRGMTYCGPGCQLKKSIEWWGIKDNGSCGCDSFAAKMDAWGPDETIRRIEEVVEHLREAANKRGFPFIATAARVMVGRAVEAARLELAKSPALPK